MKNRRNIIESELPPQNPLDIWMKDGKFYRSTKKGWTLIEDQMEFTDSKLMYKSTATSGTIGVNKETGKASIYNDITKEWSPLGGGVTETTWQELKDKRNAGKLTPGALYRITDYQCTTTQENTKSAGHQFDIVLLALSENKLAEEGWAMMHDNIYDVIFADGVTKKCYYYQLIDNVGEYNENFVVVDTLLGFSYPAGTTSTTLDGLIDESNKTIDLSSTPLKSEYLVQSDIIYNYFQNSNLSAWKVWYCLDNDKSRFAWADAAHEGTGLPNGRGVIYRLIDEWNNDVPYDFKNIQFQRKLNAAGDYDPESGENTWLYTFAGRSYNVADEVYSDWKDGSLEAPYGHENDDLGSTYHNNVIKPYILRYEDEDEDASKCGKAYLNDNVFIGYWEEIGSSVEDFPFYNAYCACCNYFGYDSHENTMSPNFHDNVFKNSCHNNTFKKSCSNNSFGNFFHRNAFGSDCIYNIFGNNCGGNKFGNHCDNNLFGSALYNKTFSNNTASKNYGNSGVELATKDDLN